MQEFKERIDLIHIEDEMKRAYIDYSMSVIIGRALPDARDGLKPGNRRILFAMHARNWTYAKGYVKCAKVVGEVIGNYHPHGDSAVYDTLVRMAQDFSMRCQLIDGQGNFGSIDGDSAAAYRYTECRLQPQAEQMLADIEKDTVDMRANFDETLQEPTVLPARLPNLLLNGSTGIAVGMATNIPPHNLGELVDALLYMIENGDCEPGDLCQFIRGPDFPTGGVIHGLRPVREFLETGRGKIKVRGRARIEGESGDKQTIIVTEIPYAVNKSMLITKIAQLVREKKIDGISDLRDESGKEGIRIVIELKRNAIPEVLLNHLYKHTQLENTFGAIMLAIDHGRPRVMNIKEALQCFLDHRVEVITRRTRFELNKAEARAHILEGYLIALDHLDEVVRTIRESSNRVEAERKLVERFGLSELQAKAILDMRLYQLTGLERDKITAEYESIRELIAYLADLLRNPHKILEVIREDLQEVRAKFSDERRTDLVADEGEIRMEDLIADEPCVITLSHTGYIKRVPIDTYRQQKRGGKGVVGMATRDEDFVEHVFMASCHDYLLCFTEAGRLYWMKVYDIPEGSRQARGKAIVNLLQMGSDDKLAALIRVRDFSPRFHLVMATRQGVVKKTNLAAYGNIRAGGVRAINIDEGDRLIGVKLTDGFSELMLTTREGHGIRFGERQLRDQGRATRGVRGINLRDSDAVVSIEVVDEKGTLLVITENGFGKRTSFDEYRVQSRGGKGLISIQTSARNGQVVSAHTVREEDAVIIVSENGQIIRFAVADLRVIGRNTQGVRLFKLPPEDRLVSATPISVAEEKEIEDDEMAGEEQEDGVPREDPSAPEGMGDAPQQDESEA